MSARGVPKSNNSHLALLTAKGITALFKGFGIDLPSQGTVLLPRTVIVSLLVGTIVTVVAGLSP